MRKKNNNKKLSVNRETLAVLDPMSLRQLAAAAITTGGDGKTILGGCQESVFVCSVRETCVSCKEEGGTILEAIQQRG